MSDLRFGENVEVCPSGSSAIVIHKYKDDMYDIVTYEIEGGKLACSLPGGEQGHKMVSTGQIWSIEQIADGLVESQQSFFTRLVPGILRARIMETLLKGQESFKQ